MQIQYNLTTFGIGMNTLRKRTHKKLKQMQKSSIKDYKYSKSPVATGTGV